MSVQTDLKCKITEIFFSLQGETKTVGIPTVFVRLTGCPLRCTYCDTAYAFSGGDYFTHDEIMQTVKDYSARYVTVTGGEPLAQKTCLPLLTRLCDAGYCVSLETGGAMDILPVDSRVDIVMDIKTPGSGEHHKNQYGNIEHLKPHHQVKFVICDKEDYLWTKSILSKYQLPQRCQVLLSPSHEQLNPGELAQWILDDGLEVRFQHQLHKFLWGNEAGR